MLDRGHDRLFQYTNAAEPCCLLFYDISLWPIHHAFGQPRLFGIDFKQCNPGDSNELKECQHTLGSMHAARHRKLVGDNVWKLCRW